MIRRGPLVKLHGVLDEQTARDIFEMCRFASGLSSKVYQVPTIADGFTLPMWNLGLCETMLKWQPGTANRYVVSQIRLVTFFSRVCGISVLVHELAHAFNPDWERFANKEGPPQDYDTHGPAWKLAYVGLLQATAEKYPEAAWDCPVHLNHVPSASEVLREMGSAAAWAACG